MFGQGAPEIIVCWKGPARGMSLRKVTSIGSNLASVTDLKRIETPHNLSCDFGGYKTFTTRWSGGTVQVSVHVQAPACHLAISPKVVLEGNRRFRGQNQRPSSWDSSPALLARVGLQHRAFPSRQQSLLAATGSLEKNMLPLLRY